MAEQIIQTLSGKVRGYERDGLVEYLGIPYAEPPVGRPALQALCPHCAMGGGV